MQNDPPLYNLAQMIGLVSEPGFDGKKAEFQLQGMIKRGLIHPTSRAGKGVTSTRLYDQAAVATAKVLSELIFMQIADRDLMKDAADSLTGERKIALSMGAWTAPDDYESWTAKQKAKYVNGLPSKTPMHYGLNLWRAGFWPIFEFRFMRNDQTGERKAMGAIFDREVKAPHFSDASKGWLPRGSIVIDLVPLFVGLFSDRAKLN